MRTGGLRDKISRAMAPVKSPVAGNNVVGNSSASVAPLASSHAPEANIPASHLVDELASALRGIAAGVEAATQPPEKKPRARPPLRQVVPAEPATLLAEPATMPQILQGRPEAPPMEESWRNRYPRVGQVIAPAVLLLALAGVALLMFTPTGSQNRYATSTDAPGQREDRLLVTSWASIGEQGGSRDAFAAALLPQPQRPPLSVEDLILIERAESMLAKGDVIGARHELATAAANGNLNAHFALAETFDPNILAARGLRVPIADSGTARALYSQSLAAGDGRAQLRLEGLQQEQ